jgi:hypothetical protein
MYSFMKGKILGFDPTNGGFIRAEDGKRYTLPANAWRGVNPPHAGEDVDFEVDGDVARETYPLTNTASPSGVNSTVDRALELLNTSNPFVQKVLENTKKISASMFALVFICFFLPFVTISCNNQPVVQLSALELTTGKTFEMLKDVTDKTLVEVPKELPGDGKATLVLAAAAAGVGTSLLKVRRSSLISAGVGAFGLLMLQAIKLGIESQLVERGPSAMGFKAEYGIGFWGPTFLFLSAIALNIWQFFNQKIDQGNTP